MTAKQAAAADLQDKRKRLAREMREYHRWMNRATKAAHDRGWRK